MKRVRGFNTEAVHAGESSNRFADAITVPVFQTSNFLMNDEKYSSPDNVNNVYTRLGNPTMSALVEKLNALSNASFGVFFSSGMGAISAVFGSFLKKEDSILCCRPIYGGTYQLLGELRNAGIRMNSFAPSGIEGITSLIDHTTRIIYTETLTNPSSQLVDIEKIARLAESHNILLVVDNTFLSPYNFTALDHGAHIEIHSLSKYINGHSDVVAGYACTNDQAVFERVRSMMTMIGSNGNPADAFLIMRGAKTLGLRMQAHNKNGEVIARFLSSHPAIKSVQHPSLEKDLPACYRDCNGYGGMIYLEFFNEEDARKFMRSAKLITEATSLGGVESLVTMPSLTSHSSSTDDDLTEAGISSSGVRLSLGVEDSQDLLTSISEALSVL